MAIIEKISRSSCRDPDFLYRGKINFEGLIPGRAYMHIAGFDKAYGGIDNNPQNVALNHVVEIIKQSNDFQYFLALVWGDQGDRMVDLIGFSDIDASDNPKNWPGNPDVSALVYKNGVYLPERKEITCGDGAIIIGLEEKHRRTRSSLKDYIENPPEIEGLRFFTEP